MNDSKVNVVVSGHRNEYHSTYKTYILRGGIPFADQVIIPDTKYVIKYDFNLGGKTIQMPAGCILEFDGGTINNGTIVGNNTDISNNLSTIFNSITIQGTWICSDVYSDWFDFVFDDNTVNNKPNLDNLFALTNDDIINEVYINCKGILYIIPTYPGTVLKSNTNIHIKGEISCISNSNTSYQIFRLYEKENCCISGGTITGDVKVSSSDKGGEQGYCISCLASKNIVIKDITLQDSWGDAIIVDDAGTAIEDCPRSENVFIENVSIFNCRRNGIFFGSVDNCTIDSCYIEGIGSIKSIEPRAAIIIEPWHKYQKVSNVKIQNCVLRKNGRGIHLFFGTGTNDGIIISNIDSDRGLSLFGKHIYVDNYISKGAGSATLLQVDCEDIIIKNSYFDDSIRFAGNVKDIQIIDTIFAPSKREPSSAYYTLSLISIETDYRGNIPNTDNILFNNCKLYNGAEKTSFFGVSNYTNVKGINFINCIIRDNTSSSFLICGDFLGNDYINDNNSVYNFYGFSIFRNDIENRIYNNNISYNGKEPSVLFNINMEVPSTSPTYYIIDIINNKIQNYQNLFNNPPNVKTRFINNNIRYFYNNNSWTELFSYNNTLNTKNKRNIRLKTFDPWIDSGYCHAIVCPKIKANLSITINYLDWSNTKIDDYESKFNIITNPNVESKVEFSPIKIQGFSGYFTTKYVPKLAFEETSDNYIIYIDTSNTTYKPTYNIVVDIATHVAISDNSYTLKHVQRPNNLEYYNTITSDTPVFGTTLECDVILACDVTKGFSCYDNSIGMKWWNGNRWILSDGCKAGVKRSGTFSEKPAGIDIYAGFQFHNKDTHKTITWDGTKWYNPDGTEAIA